MSRQLSENWVLFAKVNELGLKSAVVAFSVSKIWSV